MNDDRDANGAVNDGAYRYLLWRTLDPANARRVLFVMLNPSTADAVTDDPTIRRCIGFARAWGFGVLEVCNLFALRATSPTRLRSHRNPVGSANDEHISTAAARASRIVAAWGSHGALRSRARHVASILEATGKPVFALRLTKDGEPGHPLYVPSAIAPRRLRLTNIAAMPHPGCARCHSMGRDPLED